MTKFLNTDQSFFTYCGNVLVGSFVFPLILIYVILSIPIYIYRWMIIKLVAPYFKPDIGKVVTCEAQRFAIEFVKPEVPSRNSLVLTTTFEGHVDFQELNDVVNQRWIQAISQNGSLIFPELQQFVEPWMGFLFWKLDRKFDLKNHLYLHQLSNVMSHQDSEHFSIELLEELANKCFPLKRSPWELHLIQNYTNSDGLKMSVLVLCVQHTLADMYSLFYLLVEHLCGQPLSEARMAQPTKESGMSLIDYLTYPVRALYQLGYFVSAGLLRFRTSLHVSDAKKSWRQVCSRGAPIPMAKIKQIKNNLGVHFASVLNSCVTAALSKMYEKKMSANCKWKPVTRDIVFLNMVPLPHTQSKLTNHMFLVFFDIPGIPEMSPLERLQECERNGIQATSSPMPKMSGMTLSLFGSQLAPIARFLLINRYASTGMTNFAGVGVPFTWNGKNKVVGMDFIVGVMTGDAGIGFMVLSHLDQIRICATAEQAIFSTAELDELLGLVSQEIDALLELTAGFKV